MNIQLSQTMRLPPKSPLASPNQPKFSPHGKRNFLSPRAKIDKHGRKIVKPQQPLKMLFNNDPLNLTSICNRPDGWQSPETSSPIVDRSHEYEPTHTLPLDVKDPLNLNSMSQDDLVLKPLRKRRKRKRRNTYTNSNDQNEESKPEEKDVSLLNRSDTASIINLKNSSSLNINNIEVKEKSITLDKSVHEKEQSKAVESNDKITLLNTTETPISPKLKEFHKNNKNKHRNRRFSRKSSSGISTSESEQINNRIFNIKNEKFKYGNYAHYYSVNALKDDKRLQSFRKEWFTNKDCLDIGCNTGKLTQWVVDNFHTKSMIGLDIDSGLIKLAKKTLKQSIATHKPSKRYPCSIQLMHGPILAGKMLLAANKIKFIAENYVPSSDNLLTYIRPTYDTILCLSVTKWVQLNFGDDGLKRMLKKIYLQLRPNGRLLLEPHTYASYKRKKNLTLTTVKNFEAMKLMPTDLVSYLLSSEVGFASSECLCYSRRKKGLDRPLYLLTKGGGTSSNFISSMD